MHGLKVEHRSLEVQSLSRDLTAHMCKRTLKGKVVIVTNRPSCLLAAVRKQWLHKIHRLQIERAKTLNRAQVLELSGQISHMQSLRFSAKAPGDILEADIIFATVDDLIKFAPECYTMYATYAFPKTKLHLVTSWMPRNGVVIIYE